jgi:hypothetical protein
MTTVQMESLAFKVFCLSTIFIMVFSVQAIYNWSPFAEKISILLACTLPIGMIILSYEKRMERVGLWLKKRQVPKELIWVLLVLFFGFTSCFFSENQEASIKSMGLFLASGPLIFFTAKTLFESTKNQDSYLWMTSLCLLALSFWGIFEHFSAGIVYLFSRNPLPAGVLLILLSAGPLILLKRPNSTLIKFTLVLSLFSAIVLIILMAKKSHLLGLLILIIPLMAFRFRIFFKFLWGIIFLIGLAFVSSDSLRVKYKNMMVLSPPSITSSSVNGKITKPKLPFAIYSSIPLRVENYFFCFHVIKENPIWGLGFKADLDPFLNDYKLRLGNYFTKERYRQYIKSLNTFENIALTYLIEWGCLFSIIYFGRVIYFVVAYLRRTRKLSIRDMDGGILIAILFSFSIMSLTFDTLRFPNLNWIFHSFLGLLASLPKVTSSQLQPFPDAAENPKSLC